MTLESFDKARGIVIEKGALDAAIADLKDIMRNDTSKWIMEVRANKSHSLRSINHYGILPDVLNSILSIHLDKRQALMDELAKL